MTIRRATETIEQFAIRAAWESGHFWSPDNPEGLAITRESDLQGLNASMPFVIKALRSYSQSDVAAYTAAVMKHHHRGPDFDGQPGPAMTEFAEIDRCPVPDYVPPPGITFSFSDPDLQAVVERMQQRIYMPALGVGQWQNCHGVHNGHCAVVRWDLTRVPSFLSSLLEQVLKRVQRAYAAIGLLFRFVDASMKDMLTGQVLDSGVNVDASFVPYSDGWIGLAILGQNEGCSDLIWAKFLNTFRGGSSNEDIVTQWTTLIMHELGHNCGKSHTSGGVMNPSLKSGLPGEWTANDPSTPWMVKQFGGVPVNIPGGGDTPSPPDPPLTIEQQLRQLQINDAVQSVRLDLLTREVRDLKGS